MGDEQDRAEQLDDDVTAEDPVTSDEEPLELAPDRPYGVNEREVTPAGDSIGESLEERVDREEPDFDARPPRVEPVDEEELNEEEIVGDPNALSAEEAALHTTTEP